MEPTAVRVAELAAADSLGRQHSVIEISTGNRPFIFNSVLGELQAAGHPVRLVVHPILEVERDEAGEAVRFAPAGREPTSGTPRESFVHMHVPLIGDAAARRATRPVVDDAADRGAARHRRLARDARAPAQRRSPISATTIRRCREAVVEETIAFLQWLEEDNFVFLGMREYSYSGSDSMADRGGEWRAASGCCATRP